MKNEISKNKNSLSNNDFEKTKIALRCQNLSLSYKGKNILSKVSVDIIDNEITVILGKNGSGKTTFLKCISGIKNASEGKIYLYKNDILTLSKNSRAKKIALMPQILPQVELNVFELIAMGRSPHIKFGSNISVEDKEKILKIAEFTYIKNHLSDSVLTLSGGEKQLAFFAMALAQETKLLILDEPTSSLDVSYKQKLFEIILKLKNSGYTIILTLHDINDALNIADSIIVFDKGSIIFNGKPHELNKTDILKNVFGLSPVFGKTDKGEFVTSYINSELYKKNNEV